MDKTPRVVLSFKQGEKWIYDEIQKHSGKGNWVKDILKSELQAKATQKTEK